jgi:hypothetical protein
MAKAKLKTQKNDAGIDGFLASLKDKQVQRDIQEIILMMKKATAAEPKMWGSSIIGFGDITLKYESGRELDWFIIGLSPRKQNITLYGVLNDTLSKKLGKHSTSKGCLYFKRLEDIDRKVLQQMINMAAKSKTANAQEKKIPVHDKKLTLEKPGVKDGDKCIVMAGTHKGKSGVVRDINTSKTGAVTITVVKDDGVRFKTLAKNVNVK